MIVVKNCELTFQLVSALLFYVGGKFKLILYTK
jgi:hypothetical protein